MQIRFFICLLLSSYRTEKILSFVGSARVCSGDFELSSLTFSSFSYWDSGYFSCRFSGHAVIKRVTVFFRLGSILRSGTQLVLPWTEECSVSSFQFYIRGKLFRFFLNGRISLGKKEKSSF